MIRYACTLSEVALDDLILPISSFQMRLRQSPKQCYLNVVVPAILDFTSDIADRADGTIKISHIETDDFGNETITDLLTANISDIYEDIGARQRTGSIVGYKQITFSDTTTLVIPEARYVNRSNGVRRFRATPHPDLKPLRSATVDLETIEVDEVVWTVSIRSGGFSQVMEFKELV